MKYPEIQIIAGRYILTQYARGLQSFRVLHYHYCYRFAVIEITLNSCGLWLLGEIVSSPSGDDLAVFHELRSFATKQRAEIVYTALTEL